MFRGKFGSAIRDARSAAETADSAARRADDILEDLQSGRRGVRIVVHTLDFTVTLTDRKP